MAGDLGAARKGHDRWEGADAETSGEGRAVVAVDHHLDAAGAAARHLLEDGLEEAARAAPRRREVDEDRDVGLEDLGLERLLGDCQDGEALGFVGVAAAGVVEGSMRGEVATGRGSRFFVL